MTTAMKTFRMKFTTYQKINCKHKKNSFSEKRVLFYMLLGEYKDLFRDL